jgi:cytochrome c oxidase subunit 2
MKWMMFVLFLGATALGLGVLFQDISDRQAAKVDEGTGKKLNITATNWQFDLPEYTAVKGEPTKVTLVNKEGVHAVIIKLDGKEIKLDRAAPSQEITFDKPGTYEIECSLPCGEGHATMKSKLIVT